MRPSAGTAGHARRLNDTCCIRRKSCLCGSVNYQITFGEPLSLQHVWFSQGTENNVSAIPGTKRARKWERRDLLDASSADKPGNCADCQSEEWKGRSKRGNSASNLIHLFHRKAHKVTHRPSIPVSWLGGLLWVSWSIPQCYSRTKHLTFPLPLSCSYQLKAAPMAMNLHLSPCEKFHFNKPAEWLVCYPLSWKGLMSHLCPGGQNASKEQFQR